MKVRVTLKDPDALYDAVDEAVREWAKGLEDLSQAEREAVAQVRKEKVREAICNRFMEYGEYLEVEFDVAAETATVVPRGAR